MASRGFGSLFSLLASSVLVGVARAQGRLVFVGRGFGDRTCILMKGCSVKYLCGKQIINVDSD